MHRLVMLSLTTINPSRFYVTCRNQSSQGKGLCLDSPCSTSTRWIAATKQSVEFKSLQ
jgi:hypothetical protein